MKAFNLISKLIIILISAPLFSQERVPFLYKENKRVFIEVSVNKSKEKLLFFFDTGATTAMIDENAAHKLGIKPSYQDTLMGASGEKIFKVAENQSLRIKNNIKLDSIDFVIDDLSRLNESTGIPFHGIIGYEILDKYITEMDFDKKEFVFYSAIDQVNLKNFTPYPFTWPKEIPIPHYTINISLANGNHYSGTVLFDSGAGLNLLVNTKFQQKNNLMSQFSKKIITSSNDLTKKGNVTVSTLASLEFFNHQFTSPILTHISSDESGVSAMDGYLGILGADIINRFNYVFDYKNQIIYAKPNLSYNEPFSTVYPPLNLGLKDNKIIVSHVVPTSNAEKVGIEIGDVIVAINNKKLSNIFEAREQLLRKGVKLKLKIRKKNQKVEFKEILIDTIL